MANMGTLCKRPACGSEPEKEQAATAVELTDTGIFNVNTVSVIRSMK